MMSLNSENMMNTPWGKSQTVKKIDTGIYFVTTAGHGGYMISRKKAEKFLPANCINRGFLGSPYGGYYCYEEDCAYAVLESFMLSKSIGLYKYIESLIQEKNMSMNEYYANLQKTIASYYPDVLKVTV